WSSAEPLPHACFGLLAQLDARMVQHGARGVDRRGHDLPVAQLDGVELENVLEAAQYVDAHGDASDGAQLALRITGGNQSPERLEEGSIGEIAPSGALQRGRDDLIGHEYRSTAFQRGAAPNPVFPLHDGLVRPPQVSFFAAGERPLDGGASGGGEVAAAGRRRGGKNTWAVCASDPP